MKSLQQQQQQQQSATSHRPAATAAPTVESEKRRSYECGVCGMAFTRRIRLAEHHWMHTGKKPYECQECDASYTQRHNLNRHVLTHKGNRVYKCFVCLRKITSKHLDKFGWTKSGRRRQRVTDFKCDQCAKPRSAANNARAERSSKTNNRRGGIGSSSSKRSATAPLSAQPMLNHIKQEVIIESEATPSSAALTDEKIEVEMPTGMEVTVDIGSCLLVQILDVDGEQPTSNGQVDVSSSNHDGSENVVMVYQTRINCDSSNFVGGVETVSITGEPVTEPSVLSAPFENEERSDDDDDARSDEGYGELKLDFEVGEIIVGQEAEVRSEDATGKRNGRSRSDTETVIHKPYRCEECGMLFSRCKRLAEHAWTHTGEKPYKCDVCDASYTQRHNLTRHRKSHSAPPVVAVAAGLKIGSVKNKKATKTMVTSPIRSAERAECTVCGTLGTPRSAKKKSRRNGAAGKHYKCDVCKILVKQERATLVKLEEEARAYEAETRKMRLKV